MHTQDGWLVFRDGHAFPSPRLTTFIRDIASSSLAIISQSQSEPILLENTAQVLWNHRVLLGEALELHPWWIGDSSPDFEPTASSALEGIYLRLYRITEYHKHAGSRFQGDGGTECDEELATEFVRKHIIPLDAAQVRASIAREAASMVAKPISVLTFDKNRPPELHYGIWVQMLKLTPEYHWRLERTALLRKVRGAGRPGRKPDFQKPLITARVRQLREQGRSLVEIRDMIRKEFGKILKVATLKRDYK